MTQKNKKKESIQERLYRIPYHYIPEYDGNNFSQTENINWGFEYISAVHFIIELLSKRDFKTLLDAGCGDGRLLRELSNSYPKAKVIGVDYSERAVKLASAMNPDLQFIRADLNDAGILKSKLKNKRFEIVLSFEVLEHISPDRCEQFIKNLSDLCRPECEVILTVPSANTPVQPKHYQHFSLNDLKEMIGKHFNIEKVHYLNRKNIFTGFLRRLLTNRLFIMNNQGIKNLLYRHYIKKHLHAGREDCKRIVIVGIKKQS